MEMDEDEKLVDSIESKNVDFFGLGLQNEDENVVTPSDVIFDNSEKNAEDIHDQGSSSEQEQYSLHLMNEKTFADRSDSNKSTIQIEKDSTTLNGIIENSTIQGSKDDHNKSIDGTMTSENEVSCVSKITDIIDDEKSVDPHEDLCSLETVDISITQTNAFNESHSSLEITNHQSNCTTEEMKDVSNSGAQDYRHASFLVEYSDSENSISSSSSDSVSVARVDNIDSDYDSDAEKEKKVTQRRPPDNFGYQNRLRSNGEIFPEELPPIDYLTITVPEEVELVQLGTVSGIVEVLVVIKALEATPALSDDSVLFLENRQPFGLIFETMGTVEKPFYTVRFNSVDDINRKGITIGNKIFFAPRADNLTKYIFIAELRKMKADDASWEHDNEPPDGAREFSDDEEERRIKKKKNPSSNQKRKRQGFQAMDRMDDQRPHLKKGDLNRNPFGNQDQKFGNQSRSRLPKQGNHQNVDMWDTMKNQPQSSQFQQQSSQFQVAREPSQVVGRNDNNSNNNARQNASFGGKPSWQNQRGLLGSPAFSNGMPPAGNFNFSGNAPPPSFQGFHPNGSPLMSPRQGSIRPPPMFNQGAQMRPPPSCQLPDFTRPPPSSMASGFGAPNQFRPVFMNNGGGRPSLPPPPCLPPSTFGRDNASHFHR